MNNSISSSFYDMRSFPEFVTNLAAESAKMYNTRQSYTGQGGYNMKFYNYYQQTAPYVSQMYGNCYPKQRYMPYPNRNNGGGVGVGPSNGSATISNHQSTHCSLQQQQQPPQHLQPSSANTSSYCQQATNKSLNSSLNSSNYSDSGRNSTFYSSNNSGCSSPHHSSYSNDSAGTASTGALGGSANISGTAGSGSGSSASVSPKMPAPASQSQGPTQSQPGTAAPSESEQKEMVVLQISNLDASIDEHKMHQFLLCQLKPITPVISLTIESPSLAKVKVPSAQVSFSQTPRCGRGWFDGIFLSPSPHLVRKTVVANLHRKKVGHKRMVVSYIKDPSSAESSALRCQVAGLLKDVPFYSLPINRFRELFQSRFKSSISVLDLYRMQDVCTITLDKNDEKYIALQPDLIDTLKNSSLVETSQHSVPYCMYHFQQEKERVGRSRK
ncbi:AGAP007823-PA-like protein [Anopheles sinensis]|uniref:AGAP007823-PA-like protein n=1 Tax=Anopheles sinensis TaxID=74873 RepID=A0A084VBC9_ANOSI|nr:AGAP007823-PA-like protein [Anopheles sinensis]